MAVEGVLTSGDPVDACARFVTERYVRVAYGDRLGCVRAQAPGATANRLQAKHLVIDGDRATVVVVPSGGTYNGGRVDVALVRDGPRWRVDQLDADVPVGP
jgi:hypothetical protein